MKKLIVSTYLPFVSVGVGLQEKNLKKSLIENRFNKLNSLQLSWDTV